MDDINIQDVYENILRNCRSVVGGGQPDYPDIWLDGIANDFLILDNLIKSSGLLPDDWS